MLFTFGHQHTSRDVQGIVSHTSVLRDPIIRTSGHGILPRDQEEAKFCFTCFILIILLNTCWLFHFDSIKLMNPTVLLKVVFFLRPICSPRLLFLSWERFCKSVKKKKQC